MRRPLKGLLRQPLSPLNTFLRTKPRTKPKFGDSAVMCGFVRRYALVIRPSHRPWVVSPAVACLSGLKSAPRKRVRGNPPRVQIPPPPPTDKAKRWPRPKVGAGVRGLGLIFGLIWLYCDRLLRCLGLTRAARRADSPRRCESEQRCVRSGLPSPSLTIPERS